MTFGPWALEMLTHLYKNARKSRDLKHEDDLNDEDDNFLWVNLLFKRLSHTFFMVALHHFFLTMNSDNITKGMTSWRCGSSES